MKARSGSARSSSSAITLEDRGEKEGEEEEEEEEEEEDMEEDFRKGVAGGLW